MIKSFNLQEPNFSTVLSKSIVSWLDDSFFNDGGYSNYSGVLTPKSHPRFSNNRTYGHKHKNWVWQSGTISVFVNGVLNTDNLINYRDGLVIFNSPPSGTITCSYNYKFLDIFDAKDNAFFRGDSKSFEVYDGNFRENSIQLPCIAVELGGSNSDPVELGSYSRDIKKTIILNVFHKNSTIVERISDVLAKQIDTQFFLYDFIQSHNSGLSPISSDGFLNNSSGTYENLVNSYPFYGVRNNSCYIESSEIESVSRIDNNLFHGTVRYETSSEYRML